MRFNSGKALVAACVVTGALFAGSVAADGGDQSQRPPHVSSAVLATREVSQDLRGQLADLRSSAKVAALTAAQQRQSSAAAQNLFAATHPQLAESAGVHATALERWSALARYAVYTDWWRTYDGNNWVGLEWWYDNFTGEWLGYTVTWDPYYGTRYGNQYLYYHAGFYYGFLYWR